MELSGMKWIIAKKDKFITSRILIPKFLTAVT